MTTSTPSYTISHPKQWQDLSNNPKVIQQVNPAGAVSDVRVYGYKYNTVTNRPKELLFTGDINTGVSNSQLNQYLQDPTFKKSLISSLNINSLISSLKSQYQTGSSSNTKQNTSFSTQNYIVQVTVNFDCILKRNSTPYHVSVIMGFKNSMMFMGMISTPKNDWTINQAFYQNNVLIQGFRPL